jgi:hypothetical protein
MKLFASRRVVWLSLLISLLLVGCGGEESVSSPVDLAKSFMRSAIAYDLSAVQNMYSPAVRPEEWGQVFAVMPLIADARGCKGVDNHVTEHETEGAFKRVDITYESPCMVAGYGAVSQRASVVTIQLEKIDDHWYVNYVTLPDLQ